MVTGRILNRILDVGLLFALAGLAYTLAGIRRAWKLTGRRGSSPHQIEGPQRIVFLIHDMGGGGAQRQLILLLAYLERSRWLPEVIVMDNTDPFFTSALKPLNVPITHLESRRFHKSGMVCQLVGFLKRRPCRILHTWLPDAIQVGSIAGAIVGVPAIIGSMRSEAPDRLPQKVESWRRMMDALAARMTTLLVGNSEAVCRSNRRWARVPARRMEVVYNGIEVNRTPDVPRSERVRLRAERGIGADVPVIGIVARLDEEKDHNTFLQAAKLIHEVRPQARFAIVGDGPLRQELEVAIGRLGLERQVHMWGRTSEIHYAMQLMDVVTLTSVSEGCPNVLLEAAEIGVPIVTTAAGGATELVKDGETGFVVPCGDSRALADRIVQLIDDVRLREGFKQRARARVRSRFLIGQTADRMDAIYRRTLEESASGAKPRTSLRVCVMLSQVYGVIRPHPERVFGGAEVQVASLSRELARRGDCDVFVLTGDGLRSEREVIDGVTVVLHPLCAPPHPSLSSPAAANQSASVRSQSAMVRWGYLWLDWCPPPLAELSRSLVRGGVICRKALRKFLPVDYVVGMMRRFSLQMQWVRLLRSIDADIYVTRCAGANVGLMQRACSLLNIPFVYMIAHDMDVTGDFASAHPIEGKLFERGLRRADLVICQNEKQVELLLRRYQRRGYIVPSLCPFELASDLQLETRRTVLWIARVDEWKQPELFIRLAQHNPDLPFVMVAVASQMHPTQLSEVYRTAQAVHNLTVVPAVPLPEATRLFRDAAVFVNTSRAEGFPNTFLQAAAAGTPIVSWAVNPSQVLDSYEMGFCAQEDWDRFRQSLRLLYRDHALRVRMGKNGQAYVRRLHDPEHISRILMEMFIDLRAGHAPRGNSVDADEYGDSGTAVLQTKAGVSSSVHASVGLPTEVLAGKNGSSSQHG